MINVSAPSRYRISTKQIRVVGQVLFAKYQLPEKSILNIVFVGKRKMTAIASTYKKENVALPVLSFRYAESSPEQEDLLGEIFLCYPQVILLAAERGKKVDDTLANLIEHGLQNLLKES